MNIQKTFAEQRKFTLDQCRQLVADRGILYLFKYCSLYFINSKILRFFFYLPSKIFYNNRKLENIGSNIWPITYHVWDYSECYDSQAQWGHAERWQQDFAIQYVAGDNLGVRNGKMKRKEVQTDLNTIHRQLHPIDLTEEANLYCPNWATDCPFKDFQSIMIAAVSEKDAKKKLKIFCKENKVIAWRSVTYYNWFLGIACKIEIQEK